VSSHEIIAILVMLNNYFHDLAVGILFANVLLSVFFLRLISERNLIHENGLAEAFVRISGRITWGALAFIIVGGIIRTITYRQFEWADAAGKGQVVALIAKHVILVGCTIAGIALQIHISRKYKPRDGIKAERETEQIA
jgi:hypothetical protein